VLVLSEDMFVEVQCWSVSLVATQSERRKLCFVAKVV